MNPSESQEPSQQQQPQQQRMSSKSSVISILEEKLAMKNRWHIRRYSIESKQENDIERGIATPTATTTQQSPRNTFLEEKQTMASRGPMSPTRQNKHTNAHAGKISGIVGTQETASEMPDSALEQKRAMASRRNVAARRRDGGQARKNEQCNETNGNENRTGDTIQRQQRRRRKGKKEKSMENHHQQQDDQIDIEIPQSTQDPAAPNAVQATVRPGAVRVLVIGADDDSDTTFDSVDIMDMQDFNNTAADQEATDPSRTHVTTAEQSLGPSLPLTVHAMRMEDYLAEHKEKRNSKSCLILLLVLVVLGAVVGLVVGVLSHHNNPNPPDSAPQNSTPDDTRLLAFRQSLIRVSEEAAFLDQTSPQSQALTWLAHQDAALLPIEAPFQLLQQRYILALLFFATKSDRTWFQDLQFLSDATVCDWNNGEKGVFCDDNDKVTTIIITSNGLQGTIPTELMHLSTLLDFRLSSNKLVGTIPSNIGDLSLLMDLRLANNDLTGGIPDSIGSLVHLQKLRIKENRNLGGTLPDSIGEATSLQFIHVEECGLQGTIPESIGNLGSLKKLLFGKNDLTGSIPASIWNSPNLEQVYLQHNKLNGTVPGVGAGGAPALDELLLFGNSDLTGAALEELFGSSAAADRFPKLRRLDLGGNINITGSIPSWMGQLPKLELVALQNLGLTGTIPTELWQLPGLLWLRASGAQISGPLTADIQQATSLHEIDFEDNALTGSIPTEIEKLINLTTLVLSNNSITSISGVNWGALPNLDLLYLDGNENLVVDPTFCIDAATVFANASSVCLPMCDCCVCDKPGV